MEDNSKPFQFFLVEAVLPIGTKVCSNKDSLKVRVDKAKILRITRIKTDSILLLKEALYGRLNFNDVTLLNQVKKVMHYPLSVNAECIYYETGEIMQPRSWSEEDKMCRSGLHFYRMKEIKRLGLIWE